MLYFEALCVNTAHVNHVILCFDTLEPRDLRHNSGAASAICEAWRCRSSSWRSSRSVDAPVDAYSSVARSCEHAGVVHGIDAAPPQKGDGGYKLRIGHPGVNVLARPSRWSSREPNRTGFPRLRRG